MVWKLSCSRRISSSLLISGNTAFRLPLAILSTAFESSETGRVM